MATKTEEVRTVFTWDTSSINRGGKNIERSFSNIIEGERKVKRNLAGLASGLGNVRSGSDLAGLAIEKLSDVFKVGAGASIAIAAGFAAYEMIADKGRETIKEFTTAQNDADKAMKSATYTTTADALSELADKGNAAQDAFNKLEEITTDLNKGLMEDANAAAKRLGVWTQGQSAAELMALAEAKQKVLAKQIGDIREKAFKSTQKQTVLAKQALGGDERAAKLAEIELARKRELMQLQKSPITAGSELGKGRFADETNKRYDALGDVVSREQEIASIRIGSEWNAAQLAKQNLSQWEKRYQLALNIAAATKEVAATLLRTGAGAEAMGAANNARDIAQANVGALLHAKFLGPSGKPLSLHSIHRRERMEAKVSRREDTWDRTHDPLTGERLSGSLQGSGLRGASNAGTNNEFLSGYKNRQHGSLSTGSIDPTDFVDKFKSSHESRDAAFTKFVHDFMNGVGKPLENMNTTLTKILNKEGLT